MKNKRTIVLLMIILLPIFIVNNNEVKATFIPIDDGVSSIDMVDVDTLAPDFNITDVDTHIEYALSDFRGKIVMLDFFATWCGPCIAALPIIRELYLMYPENMFQIISIDVDPTESEALISGFRATYQMDWIVGSDPLFDAENTVIWDTLDYGSGFIPTMYLLNQTGHVIYSEIGFDEPTVRGILGSLLPDDNTKPQFMELNFYNITEFSVFNPKFRVFANISEDRNLKDIEVRIVNEGTNTYYMTANKINGFYIVNQSITLDPLFLYPLTNLELRFYVRDYFNNANLTNIYYLPIKQYVDSGPPIISNTGVEWYEVSATKYNVTVYATIVEDLLFAKKDVWFMVGAVIKKAATFEDYNATHMVASAELLYSLVKPWDLTAHLVIRDAAGNEANVDLDVAEPPITPTLTPTPTETETTESTEESSYILIVSIIGILGLVTLNRTIRKK